MIVHVPVEFFTTQHGRLCFTSSSSKLVRTVGRIGGRREGIWEG